MKQFLLSWLRNDEVDDKMIYKKAAERQEIFMRDDVGVSLLKAPVFVISEHHSKSITLPVYGVTMRNGIKIICRDNFHDWKVSVQLPKCREYGDIVVPRDLVLDGYRKNISDCYFEGFKNEWVFPAFDPDDDKQLKFSVEVSDEYRLYTLLYNLKHLFMDKCFDTEGITVDEIKSSINELYNKFNVDGNNLDGYELLWATYRHLNDYDFRQENNIEEVFWDIYKDTKAFAEQIAKYPEILNEFLMEKYLLEMEY
jgi:hypothetical protein